MVSKCFVAAIGRSIHKTLLYTGTPVLFEGHTFDIPIIVEACVDELLRRGTHNPQFLFFKVGDHIDDTGIHQRDLFNQLPDRGRVSQLVDVFNTAPNFGENFYLGGDSVHDIAGLLVHFTQNLKDWMIPNSVSSPLWVWCVHPSSKRETDARCKMEDEDAHALHEILQDPSAVKVLRKKDLTYELRPIEWDPLDWEHHKVRDEIEVRIAAILLRFLPTANLCLVSYMLHFLRRILDSPSNDISSEKIEVIFGHGISGGRDKLIASRITRWLIERWPDISEVIYSESQATYERRVREAEKHHGDTASTSSVYEDEDPFGADLRRVESMTKMLEQFEEERRQAAQAAMHQTIEEEDEEFCLR